MALLLALVYLFPLLVILMHLLCIKPLWHWTVDICFTALVFVHVLSICQVLKVAILAEKYASDYTWYVDTILHLIRIAGDHVSEEVC